MQSPHQIISFATHHEVAQAATAAILSSAQQAIAKNGKFKIVLAGGSTPNLVYQMLSQTQADWSNWWIFWGDERCLPIDNTERNSLMATQSWLEKVAIPSSQVFLIPAEKGAAFGATEYQTTINRYLPFDVVLLGMGEDGHTASLFPRHQHQKDEWVHAVYNSPKPPSDRVSLSAEALSHADLVLFLITGAGKQEAFQQWQQGIDLPVVQIKPKKGIKIYADYAALGVN
jgi:6-phosphogluconolactonase